ncbi:4-diphosphocytidyl-2-C-methyl-D-erythritol kinase [Gracilibacillus halophilus YIM-C55.5]|uniref:4-diphosphocytidyl-2-C-methyl-D-erythritol kinase n=1 Tax=Gracilibacillus halophilus YIM-C55.5 TaxID=1308866 RepID=N4WX33_9BACI|nr:4-(cytidine 5'-diphospho)-2-C-methyl-D-erythritol kinase [Gracilibacillus halophilus]ENH97616.1 4-diphosphocytidyl-2-C-methyl-D-erythritol kinase [Gracilibacillus halophilus YIM-C55.5]
MFISEKAPAKINLTLDVLYKRSDQYHEVEMVMTTVDLADRLEFVLTEDGSITVVSENRFVPSDERNLAYRAAKLLQERYQVTRGVRIYIEKQIPVAAGLAGGSSDAAATLRGLNRLWNLGIETEELSLLGSEIGSDVSFCIYNSTAIANGRGEKITELPPPPTCWVVLAKPSQGVATPSVFQSLQLDHVLHPDTQGMVDSIKRGDYQGICERLGNVLESVTLPNHPQVQQIKKLMRHSGADAVLMSGSGPTVFGLVQQEKKAERIYNSLRGFCEQVYVVRMLGESTALE